MRNDLFFTIEGGEGSGKTTAAATVAKELEALGYEVLLTREPGGIEVSESIRSIILNNDIAYETEVLLFAAARVEHLQKKVIPALKAGKIVLCDRFIDSSLVYQGYTRDMGVDQVLNINTWATKGISPIRTFFFDIKPEDALKRINGDEREVNRFDAESSLFHQKIYDGYVSLAKENKERIVRVDANKSKAEVADSLVKGILEVING